MRVEEILAFDYFKSLEVLAGADGLANPVTSCVILDYELDLGLNKKNSDQSFHPGQLVLTSLLFAKNNPALIRDAVRFVISKGVSGLVIKNVFHLPIHDSITRYADSRRFPLLVMNDPRMYFDTFILRVNKCLELSENAEAAEGLLTRLLYQPMDAGEKQACVRTLFPVLQDQYAVLYCAAGAPPALSEFQALRARLWDLCGGVASRQLLPYQDGFFLLLSDAAVSPDLIGSCAAAMEAAYPAGSVGVSSIHFRVADVDMALREAMYAARVSALDETKRKRPCLSYEDLGIYRALLPLVDDGGLQRYANEILDPILEFDAENRGNLLGTLLGFVQYGGSLRELSGRSGQHENTLRYRMDRIALLTGLNYRKLDDYEQLAMAARVYLLLNR